MYFTDSPFERLMLERPGYEDRAVDAAWNKFEKKKKKKLGGSREVGCSPFYSKGKEKEMSTLIIAEKPSVAMTIAQVLGAAERKEGYMEGSGCLVSWCYGHLLELALPEAYDARYKTWHMEDLPILPNAWKMEISKGTKKQFNTLKKLMHRKDVYTVVNACDAGREGELIFRSVYEMAECKKPMKRLWISSMEESAIREGFDNLKEGRAYDGLYEAALCRSRADWLVGMNLSRSLSLAKGKHYSVGRVISPTLTMIAEREEEIRTFQPEPFYTVMLRCGVVAEAEKMDSREAAESLAESCKGQLVQVIRIENKQKVEKAPKLYDLTTLQRDANRLFGFSAQQTLDAAQSLYENKMITYPRTDSRFLTHDTERTLPALVHAVEDHLRFTKGLNLPVNAKQTVNDGKVTDHHAIIPTMTMTKKDLDDLPVTERNVLMLVAVRLLEAVGKPFCYEVKKVTFECAGNTFTQQGKTVMETGWKIPESAFRGAICLKSEAEPYQRIPAKMAEGDVLKAVDAEVKEGMTTAPKRYTDDTLLSAMEHAGEKEIPEEAERKGIGTPATRAQVIERLVKTKNVERTGNGRQKQLVPTEKGKELAGCLPEDVRSAQLTAAWERALLKVEKHEKSAAEFMREISAEVTRQVEKLKKEL